MVKMSKKRITVHGDVSVLFILRHLYPHPETTNFDARRTSSGNWSIGTEGLSEAEIRRLHEDAVLTNHLVRELKNDGALK